MSVTNTSVTNTSFKKAIRKKSITVSAVLVPRAKAPALTAEQEQLRPLKHSCMRKTVSFYKS